MNQPKTPLALFVLVISLFLDPAVQAQAEKLGAIKFTSPKGFIKRERDDAIVFSRVDRRGGYFCFITLYAAGGSEGSAKKDFAREWAKSVVKPWDAETAPETQTELISGWMLTSGETNIYVTGNRAVAYLTVISGFGKSVSLLGILNDNSCRETLQEFAEALDIDKARN